MILVVACSSLLQVNLCPGADLPGYRYHEPWLEQAEGVIKSVDAYSDKAKAEQWTWTDRSQKVHDVRLFSRGGLPVLVEITQYAERARIQTRIYLGPSIRYATRVEIPQSVDGLGNFSAHPTYSSENYVQELFAFKNDHVFAKLVTRVHRDSDTVDGFLSDDAQKLASELKEVLSTRPRPKS